MGDVDKMGRVGIMWESGDKVGEEGIKWEGW